MNNQNAVSRSSTLQDMVKVKKLRFKDEEDSKAALRCSRDAIQRRANFEEFKAVYAGSLSRRAVKSKECPLHKTKSGSLYRFPKITNEPNYVETINIELPYHFGADRAVQLIENKIKPKRFLSKVSREVATESIVARLKKIEEVDETEPSTTDVTENQVDEIQKQMKARREAMWRNLPRIAVPKTRRRHTKENAKDKLMNTLSSINEKLEKMQKKYMDQPHVQYKSVNDCFTQSGHVEVIYENEKYPEEVKVSDLVTCDSQKDPSEAMDDFKTQNSMKEMNRLFPEFPKIEDTLREIEAHLDNIVNLEVDSGSIKKDSETVSNEETEENISTHCEGANLAAILAALEKQYSPLEHTNKILKDLDQARDDKLTTIRKQIEVVEEFCDRMSEIANDESDDTESISTAVSNGDSKNIGKDEYKSYLNQSLGDQDKDEIASRITDVSDFMEGPDLQASIKKSNYLSKEFGSFNNSYEYTGPPMIKVFSDNEQTILWRKKLRSLEKIDKTDYKNAASVTKLIDNLKFTLENSLYEAVA